MAVDTSLPTVHRVEEELQPETAPRVYVAGADGSAGRRDAHALAAALAPRAVAAGAPEGADLIAIGSARDGAPGRVTLDRAGRALLDRATCPVAVAPGGLAARGARAPRRIDLGIGGGRGSAAALAVAARLAAAHDARLRLIAVAELDFDPGGVTSGADPRELERLGHRLASATEGLPDVPVETVLREGLPDQILVGLAREADLLVLGSRATYGNVGRVAIGDVAGRVLRGAPCPTLLVPAP
jgi:nucleotide-binding universal stress UspA family protein